MKTSFYRVFFSKRAESDWLNEKGSQGLLLLSANDSRYKFEHSEEHTYHYSIEYLGFAPESEEAKAYFAKLSAEGVRPILSSGLWVYFVSADKRIEETAGVLAKCARPHAVKAAYMLSFSTLLGIVTGYQIHAIDLLSSVGYVSGSAVIKNVGALSGSGFFVGLVNFLIKLLNFLIGVVNGYFGLWQKIFGHSDAAAVISLSLPVAAVLAVLGAMHLCEFFAYRAKIKPLKKRGEEHQDITQPESSCITSEVSDAE